MRSRDCRLLTSRRCSPKSRRRIPIFTRSGRSLTCTPARRRDLDAHVAELTHSTDKALAILRAGTTDDAAERAARVLDAHKLNAGQAQLVGETMFDHRRFDRAIALLSSIPKPKPAIIFAIGRSYYGAERYLEA